MSDDDRTVLLVDDEAMIREQLASFLGRQGLRVDTASNGLEADERLKENRYDAVVLDVLMPGMDGRELLRTIRARHDWTPVILLTNVGESFERAAAIEDGADDYLNKPFDPAELLARTKALIRRARQTAGRGLGQARTLVSGDLRLDRSARTASYGGTSVPLTPKAWQLLEFLMLHPQEVFSRDRLLQSVWGFDFPTSTRAADHRVAEIRKSLGRHGGEGLIDTVSGTGYRFTDPVSVG